MITERPWFPYISRPSRYIGNEINAIRKDPKNVEVSVVLCFPDVYEVGMSHLGIKILYEILNREKWIAAERAFCPWIDLEERLRKDSLPLCSLETGRPLSEFDIIGFSIQHELCYTNILTMLSLCNIPFFYEQREDPFPLVIAGGPACFNPEPFSRFFDLILIGDGEEALLEICKRVREAKRHRIKDKHHILDSLKDIQGVYIPAFGKYPVKRAIVSDIDKYPYPTSQIVPYTELIHDRLSVEIFRGCSRGCRFCQAGYIYRPVRERSPYSVIEKVMNGLKNTGYEEISLLSLSSGDYSCIEELLVKLMDILSDKKVAISLPSLRIDTMSPVFFEQIKRVRKTGFTLAPEAGNERLRKVINKNISDEQLIRTAKLVYDSGWNLLKLYFMIGLPKEKEGDLDDLVRISKEIADYAKRKKRRNRLNISIATFVPKPHTPFMWERQLTVEEAKHRIFEIKDKLKAPHIKVKWNSPDLSWLEGIFSRGDRRLSEVIVSAWKKGARFDSWTEMFKKKIWDEAFYENGIDPDSYLKERDLCDRLPWEYIDCGIRRDFFIEELKKAYREEVTSDCREKCNRCGICDFKKIRPVSYEGFPIDIQVVKKRETVFLIKKYRAVYTKIDVARFLSHLETIRAIIRALRRANINLLYSEGFHPTPKISFSQALPVGVESMCEIMDIQVKGELNISDAKRAINKELPKGIKIISMYEVPLKSRIVPKETHYMIVLRNGAIKEDAIRDFLDSESFYIKKQKRKEEKEVDIRRIVKSISVESEERINLVIKHGYEEVRASEIVKAILSIEDQDILRIIKMRQVI